MDCFRDGFQGPGRSFLTEKERFGKPSGVPMGEKGIGRLSVAYLGSPMLMLTKSKGRYASFYLWTGGFWKIIICLWMILISR